jgi:hypothetical protein
MQFRVGQPLDLGLELPQTLHELLHVLPHHECLKEIARSRSLNQSLLLIQ